MRSVLTVSAVALIYVVGLMGATGTSIWTAAVSDQDAAALFGGACTTFYTGISCPTTSSSCRPTTCYHYVGTTATIRASISVQAVICAGGTNYSCSAVYLPDAGCMAPG